MTTKTGNYFSQLKNRAAIPPFLIRVSPASGRSCRDGNNNPASGFPVCHKWQRTTYGLAPAIFLYNRIAGEVVLSDNIPCRKRILHFLKYVLNSVAPCRRTICIPRRAILFFRFVCCCQRAFPAGNLFLRTDPSDKGWFHDHKKYTCNKRHSRYRQCVSNFCPDRQSIFRLFYRLRQTGLAVPFARMIKKRKRRRKE